jgi:hypothetical protein
MRTLKRFYIGEILDLYKKGNSGQYGSVESSDNVSQLAWLSLRVYLPLKMSAVSLFIIILFEITQGHKGRHGNESNDDNDDLR